MKNKTDQNSLRKACASLDLNDKISCKASCVGYDSVADIEKEMRDLLNAVMKVLRKYFSDGKILEYDQELALQIYDEYFGKEKCLSDIPEISLTILLSDGKFNIIVVYGNGKICIKYKSGDTKLVNLEYENEPYSFTTWKGLDNSKKTDYRNKHAKDKISLAYKDTDFHEKSYKYLFDSLTEKELENLSTFSFLTVEFRGDIIESIDIRY